MYENLVPFQDDITFQSHIGAIRIVNEHLQELNEFLFQSHISAIRINNNYAIKKIF